MTIKYQLDTISDVVDALVYGVVQARVGKNTTPLTFS
jgi:hypothetical protein